MSRVDPRGRLGRAPWWVLSLSSAALLGLFRFTLEVVRGAPVGSAAVSAAVTGLLFGLIFGPLARRMGDQYLEVVADVPTSKQRAVRTATTRGPVPEDPEIRRAAVRVVDHRIATFRRMRWAILMWLLFIGLSVWLAVSDSRWWWLSALLFAFFLVQHLWTARRLAERRSLLAERPSPR